MRSTLTTLIPFCQAGAVSLFLLSLGAATAQESTPLSAGSLPAVNTAFKSLFVDDAQFGKDPFFPRSTRRAPLTTVEEAPTAVVAPIEGLELKGLAGAEPNRLAIINNRTFAAGEELPVRIDDQRIPVKCLEIREKSVVVNVGGVTRELFFRKKP